MHVDILTPEKNIYSGEAIGVKMPGIDGGFEILNHHAPLISALGQGEVRINTSEGDQKFSIESGFVEVLNNKVVVLVEGVG